MAHKIIQLKVEDHDNFIHIIADYQHQQALVVDPAWDAEGIKDVLQEEGLNLIGVLITHSDDDHINALDGLLDDEVSVFIGEHEAALWENCPKQAILLVDGDRIAFGNQDIEVLHTPGHTAGSLCYRIGNDLITGDTLFIYGCGRVGKHKAGNIQALYHSLQRLKTLPDELRLWVGHDYGCEESSTLGEQKSGNPFLMIDDQAAFIKYRRDIASKVRQIPYQAIDAQTLAQQLSGA